MIYSKIENVFKKQGCLSVIESIDWARKQSGGIIKMVDKFVLLLDKNNFLDKRKAEFNHIVGAGPGCEPTLIYKANDLFNKDKIKSEIEIRFIFYCCNKNACKIINIILKLRMNNISFFWTNIIRKEHWHQKKCLCTF